MRALRALPLLLLPACSKSATAISLDLTTCQETTAFTDAPAVTSCDVTVKSLDGMVSLMASAAPGGTFDFATTVPDSEQVSVTVSCTASDGTEVMAGSSLSGLLLSSVGSDVPVFVQRTEQWARPCGSLSCSHLGGAAFTVEDRYLNVTGGLGAGDMSCNPTSVDAYDVYGLTGDNPVASPLPCDPTATPACSQTAVSLGVQTLFITSLGSTLYDWTSGNQSQQDASFGASGLSAQLAGGAVVPACLPTSEGGCTGGTRYFVVGATRLDKQSTAVLEVDLDLQGDPPTYASYTLTSPRQGAAAVWISGVGLVVAGGSATAPGVEVLDDTTGAFKTLPYSPDPVVGAGAAVNGTSGVLLVGGVNGMAPAPTRTLDPGCAAPCAPVVQSSVPLPRTLEAVSLYQLSGGRYLAIGDELGPMGMTHSYVVDLDKSMVTEPLLREPRHGATTVAAPNGTLALLGGQHADGTPALSIELFQP